MNAMVQKSSKAIISLFIKKYKGDNKRNSEAEMNNIKKEIYDLSLTGSVISTIYGTEDIISDTWNIELGYNKYVSGLVNINCVDIYCINKIGNIRGIKNIKQVVVNYYRIQTKYSNECFNILDNVIYFKKNNITQYTLVLYETLILAIKVKIFMRSGRVKYCTLKILLDYGTSATIVSSSLIPKARRKNNTTTNWDTRGGVFQTQAKATA